MRFELDVELSVFLDQLSVFIVNSLSDLGHGFQIFIQFFLPLLEIRSRLTCLCLLLLDLFRNILNLLLKNLANVLSLVLQ